MKRLSFNIATAVCVCILLALLLLVVGGWTDQLRLRYDTKAPLHPNVPGERDAFMQAASNIPVARVRAFLGFKYLHAIVIDQKGLRPQAQLTIPRWFIALVCLPLPLLWCRRQVRGLVARRRARAGLCRVCDGQSSGLPRLRDN